MDTICHCEERSDKAISDVKAEIATPSLYSGSPLEIA